MLCVPPERWRESAAAWCLLHIVLGGDLQLALDKSDDAEDAMRTNLTISASTATMASSAANQKLRASLELSGESEFIMRLPELPPHHTVEWSLPVVVRCNSGQDKSIVGKLCPEACAELRVDGSEDVMVDGAPIATVKCDVSRRCGLDDVRAS